jgi:hypothetical protein
MPKSWKRACKSSRRARKEYGYLPVFMNLRLKPKSGNFAHEILGALDRIKKKQHLKYVLPCKGTASKNIYKNKNRFLFKG